MHLRGGWLISALPSLVKLGDWKCSKYRRPLWGHQEAGLGLGGSWLAVQCLPPSTRPQGVRVWRLIQVRTFQFTRPLFSCVGAINPGGGFRNQMGASHGIPITLFILFTLHPLPLKQLPLACSPYHPWYPKWHQSLQSMQPGYKVVRTHGNN